MAEYIEREGLMRELGPFEENDFFQEMSVILQIVAGRPAVDVAPVRHGRWEYVTNVSKTRGWYGCSRCGSSPPYKASGIMDAEATYCPNCGAKMDGEEAEP